MNKAFLLLTLITFSSACFANDTIQMILESQGIYTEDFEIIEESVKKSKEELINAVNLMNQTKLMMAQVTIDHHSEAGDYLSTEIPKFFRPSGSATTAPTLIPHLIFDDLVSRGGNIPPSLPERVEAHDRQHIRDVQLIQQVAIQYCNRNIYAQRARIPVFTAPQNLVDILLGVRPASFNGLSYSLHDGVTYHCIAPR